MKSLNLFTIIGTTAMILVGCTDLDPVISDKTIPDSQPYVINSDNYAYYRIPTMVITKHDIVLAFAEGRVDGREDSGNIDVVLKRSGDRGRTWQDLIVVFDDGSNTCHNPCPIYIPETNRVVLLMNENYSDSKVFVTYSDNEGQTWSTPQEITEVVRPTEMSRFTQGPSHGIVKQLEPCKGRLIVPGYQRKNSSDIYHSNAIYSDDNGATWEMGGVVPTGYTNETTVCELSDGSLLMSIRMADDTTYRSHSISKDGGETWSEVEIMTDLPDPGCQGSIFTYSYGDGNNGANILLFSNPAGTKNRKHNTLRVSLDDGKSWNSGIDYTGDDVGGYSDIATFSDGEIAILSEFGTLNEGGIIFKKYTLDEVKQQ